MILFLLKDGGKILWQLGKLAPSFISHSFLTAPAQLPENHIVLMAVYRIVCLYYIEINTSSTDGMLGGLVPNRPSS